MSQLLLVHSQTGSPPSLTRLRTRTQVASERRRLGGFLWLGGGDDVRSLWPRSLLILSCFFCFLSPSRRSVLQLKLQQRRSREELVGQGIMTRE